MGRVEWLDGWRAVAVAIVIASHLAHAYGWHTVNIPGKLGVYIFFAISGYIVTKILLVEQARTGAIDLRHFYIRRALRILPPLAIYLAFCVAAYWPSISVQLGAARSLSFTCNMALDFGDCGWVFGHTWSLGFEEQFYLLMPFVLIGIRGWWSGSFLVLALALAMIPFVAPIFFIGRIGFVQIYMLLGLGALYARFESSIAATLKRIPTVISLTALVLAGVWVTLPPSMVQLLTGLLAAPAVFMGVFALPLRSAAARWLLASRPLRTVGLYSYTLYLWQQLALTEAPWNVGLVPVLSLCGALLFSALSYHTLEAGCRQLAGTMKRRRAAVSRHS